MKRKTSALHDEAMVRMLRNDRKFAAEYLKAALEDEDEPRVLLIALRRLAQARGIVKVAKAAAVMLDAEAYQRLLDIAASVDAQEGIRQALQDVNKGKIRPAKEFFDDFEAERGARR